MSAELQACCEDTKRLIADGSITVYVDSYWVWFVDYTGTVLEECPYCGIELEPRTVREINDTTR